MDRRAFIGLSAGVAAGLATGVAHAQAPPLEKVNIVIFGAPSLGAFLPPVIKAQKFDEAQGLSIQFEERTPDAYTAQFNSGEFKVGGSAAILTLGLADIRGVKVAYLFNLFDFWGAVVSSRPDVQSLKDLEGKDLAAAKGTTNYVMFDWLARQKGIDLSKVSVVNTATPGLVGYALADRASAVQLWEPAYTTLVAKKPEMRMLDLDIAGSWQKFSGSTSIPYLGVAAHVDWIAQNPKTVGKLYAAYRDAAAWIGKNPAAAADVIDAKGTAESKAAIAKLIMANERLGLNLKWAEEQAKEIEAVYKAGQSTGYLPGAVSAGTIYRGPRT